MKKVVLFILIFFGICYFTVLNNNEEIKEILNVRVKMNESIKSVEFEEYITGVLAGEMPITFELEALKAQAVAARSYVLTKMKYNKSNDYDVVDTVMNQVYLDDDYLKSVWKESYDSKISKIKKAVDETKGQYLAYDGEVINAMFFSTSVGKTENCEEIFPNSLPYLKSVSSTWDSISPHYEVKYNFSINDFYNKLGISYSDYLVIDVLETTSTGRIKKISINGTVFSGSDVVNKLGLKSNYFLIKKNKNEINIITKGYGHGVGMSQYGAQAMALNGYDYKSILKHYYTDVELLNL